MSVQIRRSRVVRLAGITAALLTATYAVSAADPPATATGPQPAAVTYSTVFERNEAGYNSFRIPAILEADDGTLLAFAEGRVDDPDDDGDIDLVLKRSFDGGLTWEPLQVLADDANKWGNPVPMLAADGRLVLNLTRTGGTVTGEDVRCGTASETDTRRSFMIYSDDDGATWDGLTEITADVRPGNWGHFVGGPGHGITMTSPSHPGRLVIPGNHSIDPPSGSGIDCLDSSLLGAHTLYSDDGGDTWELGAVEPTPTADYHPHESTGVELDDGTLYFSARDQRGVSPGHRVDATSGDGGETFDATFGPTSGITTSEIGGSLTKIPAGTGSRLVFSATGHPTSRENLTLWTSDDDGTTWQPGARVYDGPSGYSDLADLGGGTLGVLYENGERLYDEPYLSYSHRITFARVPYAEVDDPPPPAPQTPDTSGNGLDGLVSGSPQVVGGAFGSGLELAGDYVELPNAGALRFGTGAFTAAAWFRSTSPDTQAVLWAHSRIDGEAKWWIRLEPDLGRIRALLDSGTATRSVTAPGNFADGTWHHVALVRGSGGVTLYVDGVAAGTGAAFTGSVSAAAATGIRVGSRVDGINDPMRGAADEVWFFDRALTAAEVGTLADDNTAPSADTVAHLPLDIVDGP
jgi:BNR repeat-like domain/Concanavalin A-like lectin/glucanases superfamily